MKPSGQSVFFAAAVLFSATLVGYGVFFHGADGSATPPGLLGGSPKSALKLADIPFDGAQAQKYLKEICDLGSRKSGSKGMKQQQEYLTDYFTKLGGKVSLQEFRVRDPLDGHPTDMANLIVEWHPDRQERILLCAHYDTRPFPDRDTVNRRGLFLGANDGASGVAVLMQLAQSMGKIDGRYGVDFVLFDGEELVYDELGTYFLGAEYFARHYAANPAAPRYRWGVLLDMVGDADLQIYEEEESMSWKDVKPLVREIWGTAKQLGVREFIPKVKHRVNDDHVPLHNIAKIPICDVIDLDYPYWHTTGDSPEHCSALSLAKVGWVIEEWLKGAVAKSGKPPATKPSTTPSPRS